MSHDAHAQHARILLIEDDEVLSDVVLRNLRIRGHEVITADSAEKALTQLRTMHFDLVILDINLPDRTGWDILRIAQREGYLTPHKQNGEQEQKLPVVVLSAVRVSPTRLAEFHPLAYLPKPFPMDALLRLATEATHE
jgi:DNA-binding response OmpR family regulator